MKKQIIDGIEIYSIDLKKRWSIIQWVALILAVWFLYMLADTAYLVITNYNLFF